MTHQMSEVTVRANRLLEEAAEEVRGEVVSTLRAMGLSTHAANVLYALARVPEATAGELIVRTGIPDSKIYYALNELAEMGLLEVQEGKPKTYRSVAPREAKARLQRMLAAKHEREQAAVTRLASLLEPLRAASKSTTMDLAYVVKGLSNVLARAEAMIASARREVLVLMSEEAIFRKLETKLEEAALRGVRVRIAAPDIPLAKELQRLAEVRAIVCECAIVVVDGQQILTISGATDGSFYAITSTDETLVRLGLDYWGSPRCCVSPSQSDA